MISRLNRQDLIKRAQAELERRTVRAPSPVCNRWWSDAADAEYEAWRAGGALPNSAEALELVEIYIWLEENV